MLNRFSKDIETVDSSLASSLQAVNTSLASFFASVLTVSVIFPPFVAYAFAVGVFYYRLARGYLSTGRDLRRMESNSRSPIFSGFSELLEGIVTVRAFSAEQRFLDDLHGKIDLTTQVRAPRGHCPHALTGGADVVRVLDDEPLAAPPLRRRGRGDRVRDDAVRALGRHRRGPRGRVYHLRDGVHVQRVLGVPLLDHARARPQVGPSSLCVTHRR
jgi:hypothetical protein